MMDKKGMSEIITTIIMIALALIAVGIVWGVVSNLITTQTEKVSACANLYDKLQINEKNTCFDEAAGELYVGINVGNINPTKVLLTVSVDKSSTTYDIPGTYSNVKDYGGAVSTELTALEKNSGRTYVVKVSSIPDAVQLTPVMNNIQCDSAGSFSDIPKCLN